MSDPLLPDLLHDFGGDWQITVEPGGLFVAIERQPYMRHYVAETGEQLRDLLANDAELRQ